MKKRYEVIWAEAAENDLLKIIKYIVQNNPVDALKILKKIKKQVDNLFLYPERCRLVPELYVHGITQYREMIIHPWRVMYRIMGLRVYVLSILDSRQNIEDILLKRLIQNIF